MGNRHRSRAAGVVGAWSLCVMLAWAQASSVHAQASDTTEEAPPADADSDGAASDVDSDSGVHPGRIVATSTVGLALRLTQDVDFDQDVLAPFYLDVGGGYVFGSRGAYHHGLGLGVSFNLSADGGYTEPVHPAHQWALSPSYLGFWELGPDFFGLGHVSVPILISGTQSVGLELGAGAAYRLLAGFGLYTELSFAAFVGAGTTFHPLFCWELGLSLDYEVLP